MEWSRKLTAKDVAVLKGDASYSEKVPDVDEGFTQADLKDPQKAQAIYKVIQSRLDKCRTERPIGYLVREAPAEDVRQLQQLAGHVREGGVITKFRKIFLRAEMNEDLEMVPARYGDAEDSSEYQELLPTSCCAVTSRPSRGKPGLVPRLSASKPTGVRHAVRLAGPRFAPRPCRACRTPTGRAGGEGWEGDGNGHRVRSRLPLISTTHLACVDVEAAGLGRTADDFCKSFDLPVTTGWGRSGESSPRGKAASLGCSASMGPCAAFFSCGGSAFNSALSWICCCSRNPIICRAACGVAAPISNCPVNAPGGLRL